MAESELYQRPTTSKEPESVKKLESSGTTGVSTFCGPFDRPVEQYSVELDIFSGRPNPKWVIIKSSRWFSKLEDFLEENMFIRECRLPAKLGYRGFHIIHCPIDKDGKDTYIVAGSNPAFEKKLLDSNPAISDKIRDIVENSKNVQKSKMYNVAKKPTKECTVRNEPNRADFSLTPVFNPHFWKKNGHILKCNNCYNYATQRRTDTFAQPGTWSGRRYDEYTAEDVMAASVRDGFIKLGMDQLTPHDDFFCNMALFILPGEDYHWYRRESDGTWSHKPGRTHAINTDNAGQLITDPRTADRGEYMIFAGFVKNVWGPNIG